MSRATPVSATLAIRDSASLRGLLGLFALSLYADFALCEWAEAPSLRVREFFVASRVGRTKAPSLAEGVWGWVSYSSLLKKLRFLLVLPRSLCSLAMTEIFELLAVASFT